MAILAAYSFPFKGINTSVPDNHIDRSECRIQENFLYYEGLLQPPAYEYFGPLDTPDGNAITAVATFNDPNNVLRHVVITKSNLYELLSTGLYSAAYPLPATAQSPTKWQVFSNRLFFVNGSQYVLYWDGTALTQATNLYGAKYIFELGSSICIANTTEAGGNFPQRVRWAVAGTFNEWDPGTFTGAGFEDLLECPDGISGVINTSPVAYIVRTNGITQMIPTGVGTSAFNFNHLWASQQGIGDIFGTFAGSTVASYGPVGFIVAADDVYVITASSYDKIGSKVKNQLYAQLLVANLVLAWIEPTLTQGVPYLRYRIGINTNTGNFNIWSYSTEINGWEYEVFQNLTLTGFPSLLNTIPFGPFINNYMVMPVLNGVNHSLLWQLNPATGTIINPASYTFKTEYDPQDRSITVRQVKVRYQYLGQTSMQAVPLTVTITGMYGAPKSATLNLADPKQSKAYYGGALPPSITNKFYNAYFNVPMTDQEFQVKLDMAPPLNSGTNSIRISDVVVLGDVGQEVSR